MFLKVLPLKEDREESLAVYSCICNLVTSSNSQVSPEPKRSDILHELSRRGWLDRAAHIWLLVDADSFLGGRVG